MKDEETERYRSRLLASVRSVFVGPSSIYDVPFESIDEGKAEDDKDEVNKDRDEEGPGGEG